MLKIVKIGILVTLLVTSPNIVFAADSQELLARARTGGRLSVEQREYAANLYEQWLDSERGANQRGDQNLGRALSLMANGRSLPAAERNAFGNWAEKTSSSNTQNQSYDGKTSATTVSHVGGVVHAGDGSVQSIIPILAIATVVMLVGIGSVLLSKRRRIGA